MFSSSKMAILVGVALVLLAFAVPVDAAIIYVNIARPDDSGDGLSWATAKKTLQAALVPAAWGDEIWVAAGTYMPDQGGGQTPGNRSATFTMKSGVGIYGGFAGTETVRAERNFNANPTILSGDIPGPNSYHVVFSSFTDNTAVLDGFTITAGTANGTSNNSVGAGMYNEAGSPTVANCKFISNTATGTGGGMYNTQVAFFGSNPTVTNCTFSGNSANGGGGMANLGSSSNPTVTNCTFSGNSSTSSGGAMYNQAGTITVNGCTFTANSATFTGGGMYSASNDTLSVFNSTFTQNTAASGGGAMYNQNNFLSVRNCAFFGNSTSGDGGAMFNSSGNSVIIRQCIFSGNSAGWGGAMTNATNLPTITNCTFRGNTASNTGGGVYVADSSGRLTNCILWNNAPNQIVVAGGSPTVTHNIVQGGWSGGGAVGNLNANPLFVDFDGPDNIVGTPDDNLRLLAGSPAIDSGNNGFVSVGTTDLDGNPRFVDDPNTPDTGVGTPPIVDRGPYEYQPPPPPLLYVRATASGANNGRSWANAFQRLQDALDLAANSGGIVEEIWVASGTYRPDQGGGQTPGDRSATFQLLDGVAIYGGFAGTETSLAQRNFAANLTILSGDLSGNDVPVACANHEPDCDSFGRLCHGGFCIIAGNNAENSYHVVTGSGTDATAILDGFILRAGNANGASFPDDRGAGMLNAAGSPTVTNCRFSGNSALENGGGMYNENSSPTVTKCTFRGNSAGTDGGGMFNSVSSSSRVTNCTFSGNSAIEHGGGMHNDGSNPTLTNCTFSGNSAIASGGGMYNDNGNPTVTNCTFSENSTAGSGGGISNNISSPTVTSSVLWGNSDLGGMGESAQIHIITGTPVVNYSIVQGGWSGAGGTGVMNADPLFVDADGADNIPGTLDDDLRLRRRSPAIDAGDTTALPLDIHDLDDDGNTTERIPIDLAGNPRVVDDPETDDVGVPGSAVVDMGAFEYVPDCNENGIVDSQDIANCSGDLACGDCNGNGIPDGCELVDCAGDPGCADCNENGILDECDIAGCSGDPTCEDCNDNGIPDGCELADCAGDPGCADCNENGILDECDIASATSLDVNMNGVPDECGNFTGACEIEGQEDYWTCVDNWDLNGQYPDDVDGAAGIYATVGAPHDVFLDATVIIPALRLRSGAQLRITQSGTEGDLSFAAPALLDVRGTVLLSGDRAVGSSGQAPTVTVGPDGVIEAQAALAVAAGEVSASLTAASVQVLGNTCHEAPCPHGGRISLTDSMSLATLGDIHIDGSSSNGHCHSHRNDQAAAMTFHTPPSLRIVGPNSQVIVGTNMALSGVAEFHLESTRPLEISGDWQNRSIDPACFAAGTGAIRMNGASPQTFEVAATDTGVSGVSSEQFRIGVLTIASDSDVTLVDEFDNDSLAQISCGEAQYVETLILEAGSTLTVQDCRLYYSSLVADPTAQVIQQGCGAIIGVEIPPPVAEPAGLSKSRAISFIPPGESGHRAIGGATRRSAAVQTAIRVVLVSLHHVNPPYAGGPSVPFTAFEGEVRWVGPPVGYTESASSGTPFQASMLQCSPHYQDWSTVGLLHVFGSTIVPSSEYHVQTVSSFCQGIESSCANVSKLLIVRTTRWGDVETPFNPPSPSTQPDLGDVSALVNKFRSAPGAPIKARALLVGIDAIGTIDVATEFSFTHIAACVDAFRGRPYPHTIEACP